MYSTLKQFSIPVLVCIGLGMTLTTCELINPEEQIPSFIQIDSFSLSTSANQGYPAHKLTDAWVYANEALVGVYELPALVPILSEGPTDIRIEAGMRVSGLVGQRSSNPFMRDYLGSVHLVADSAVVINPTIVYEDSVIFRWKDDFDDNSTNPSIQLRSGSEGTTMLVSGAEAFVGRSLKLSLPEGSNFIECRSASSYNLRPKGKPVILEFSYRSNNRMVLSLYSLTGGGTAQTTVLSLNPSSEWNHVYISLTPTLSSSILIGALLHDIIFGFIRDEGVIGEAFFTIDNVKMMHYDLQ